MSIFNATAPSGGGGGIEMEQGTFTANASNVEVLFTDTHTAAPDIVLVSPVDSTQMSNAVAVEALINGTGNIDIDLAINSMPDHIRGLVGLIDGGYYNGYSNGSLIPATSAQISNMMSSTGFGVSNLEYGIDYEWWAIWASGSGGGGGGGGGSAKNVQTNQTTSRTSSTSLTSVNSLTCSTAGTYDVYWTCDRSSTSGTWSSQLYLGGTAYGSEQTTWSNHVQTVHLSNVSISANQTVAVYVKARGTNYYGYAPQLTIVQS